MRDTQAIKNHDRLLCAVAILCFLVQQLWAPVQCVLHEHEIGDSGLAQAGVDHCPTHVGRDHMHGDEVVHSGEEDPDHEPHPLEDELTRGVERLAPRASEGVDWHTVVCVVTGGVVEPVHIPRLVGMAWYAAHPAHSPPERFQKGPRGPPVTV